MVPRFDQVTPRRRLCAVQDRMLTGPSPRVRTVTSAPFAGTLSQSGAGPDPTVRNVVAGRVPAATSMVPPPG